MAREFLGRLVELERQWMEWRIQRIAKPFWARAYADPDPYTYSNAYPCIWKAWDYVVWICVHSRGGCK
jgi:hypothetical protein